ncbi:hypothetical protein PIB30_056053 [Stylosanthes scabra]|uniref:Subtilisin-like protease SBT4.15 n=1 Tax=Stylosanthes scabra TaxID=79078 RepID=A0ABU6ZHY3_9FABA|nr:hypothetical protein [Stylosanthes scabra]
MGELPETTSYAVEDHHHNLLTTAMGNKKLARESKIHSYGKSFNGFVARLLPHEAKKLQEEENVVSVFPNKRLKLHTTRSWDFLGMHQKVKRRTNVESHIVVGVLDTGIWVDCPSFNDEGFGPPPRRWKGKCVTGPNFTSCNNKVIGAKYFNLDQVYQIPDNISPADDQGHGTHTASTAAGVAVKDASLYGIGKGTARGGVPSARVAMYKVCWSIGCSDMDMLAGFDDAIADGVNFISVSIGGPSRDFFNDPIAIGAFHAMKRGILTSCSAGNDGPHLSTVENVAPWILTVGASTVDRKFTTVVAFGNGKNATGLSINTFSPEKKMYPLINGVLAANETGDGYGNPISCDYGTLREDKVQGKIVYCIGGMGGQDLVIKHLGGAGTIIGLDDRIDDSFNVVVPAAYVEANTDGKDIDQYINSTKDATAVIHKTTSIKTSAPFVATFSSRGPQFINPNILKPDLAAPGQDILAAYSRLNTITGYPEDTRHDVYNIISGTSMASPHAVGAAAYVKSFHPDWSPAAIKSALMTTATPLKTTDNFSELAAGAGQMNPLTAVHPGLVYDIRMDSYVAFLCKAGYNATNIGILIGTKSFNCTGAKLARGTDGLNYPTMHLQLMSADEKITAVYHRRVMNVGGGTTTYKAKVTAPEGVSVEVIPDTLEFSRLHQELSFKVVLKGPPMAKVTRVLTGSVEWQDSKHNVRSPILLYKPML